LHRNSDTEILRYAVLLTIVKQNYSSIFILSQSLIGNIKSECFKMNLVVYFLAGVSENSGKNFSTFSLFFRNSKHLSPKLSIYSRSKPFGRLFVLSETKKSNFRISLSNTRFTSYQGLMQIQKYRVKLPGGNGPVVTSRRLVIL